MIYDNKEYLYQKYVVENLSTVKIAKKHGLDPSSIRKRLKKFGINLRNFRDGQVNRYGKWSFIGCKDTLYGSLLGDGCLSRRNKNGSATFIKANIGYDHVAYAGQLIMNSDPSDRIKEIVAKSNWYPCGEVTSFRFTTRSCDEFLAEYLRWYQPEKIVPKDLHLTPTVMLHWFMDDGHCCWKDKKKTRVEVGFATESFTIPDCEFLCHILDKQLGLSATLHKHVGGYERTLHLRAASIFDFFDMIGPCPVPSMAYKWKLG